MTPQQAAFFHDLRATRAEAERDNAERQLAAALVRIRTLEATVRALEPLACDPAALAQQRAEVEGVCVVVALDAWRRERG